MLGNNLVHQTDTVSTGNPMFFFIPEKQVQIVGVKFIGIFCQPRSFTNISKSYFAGDRNLFHDRAQAIIRSAIDIKFFMFDQAKLFHTGDVSFQL